MSLHSLHQYHTEVEKIIRFGSTANETAIHSVLFNLLNECLVSMKYAEYDVVEINKNIIMNIGLWVYGNYSIAFNALEHDPFVVDKFEDIETIVKQK